MLLRFRADVVELQPKAVVILAGTNDIAGNAGSVTLDQVEDNLASMAELARTMASASLRCVLRVSDDKKDTERQALTRTRPRRSASSTAGSPPTRRRAATATSTTSRPRPTARACCSRRSTTTACTRTPAATP
jgi:hypothetical protein